MVKREREGSESLVHAQSVDVLQRQTAAEFHTVVGALLKDAPNASYHRGRLTTDYGNQEPTDKTVVFKFRNSTVLASYHVDHGTPPTYTLEITTPIVVDNLEPDFSARTGTPLDPHEIIELESTPYYGTLEVRVKAVNRLGDFGHEITLDRYTARGLLPPINPLGRGKIDTFKSVIALFDGVVPQDPKYKQPFVSSSSIRP